MAIFGNQKWVLQSNGGSRVLPERISKMPTQYNLGRQAAIIFGHGEPPVACDDNLVNRVPYRLHKISSVPVSGSS